MSIERDDVHWAAGTVLPGPAGGFSVNNGFAPFGPVLSLVPPLASFKGPVGIYQLVFANPIDPLARNIQITAHDPVIPNGLASIIDVAPPNEDTSIIVTTSVGGAPTDVGFDILIHNVQLPNL